MPDEPKLLGGFAALTLTLALALATAGCGTNASVEVKANPIDAPTNATAPDIGLSPTSEDRPGWWVDRPSIEPEPIEEVKLDADVLFETDSAVLDHRAGGQLAVLAERLAVDTTRRAVIHGHTDDTGEPSYNLDLSGRRAEAVADYLVEHGVARSRLTTIGWGSTDPIGPNDTNQNRARNRRVVVVIEGDEHRG